MAFEFYKKPSRNDIDDYIKDQPTTQFPKYEWCVIAALSSGGRRVMLCNFLIGIFIVLQE